MRSRAALSGRECRPNLFSVLSVSFPVFGNQKPGSSARSRMPAGRAARSRSMASRFWRTACTQGVVGSGVEKVWDPCDMREVADYCMRHATTLVRDALRCSQRKG